jgi:hypothetical protein
MSRFHYLVSHRLIGVPDGEYYNSTFFAQGSERIAAMSKELTLFGAELHNTKKDV